MMLTNVVKSRADCTRRQVGSIIVKDFRIISTGYNGTPHKIKNCSEGGCLRCLRRDKGEIKGFEYEESCVCIHAEQNTIFHSFPNFGRLVFTFLFYRKTFPSFQDRGGCGPFRSQSSDG